MAKRRKARSSAGRYARRTFKAPGSSSLICLRDHGPSSLLDPKPFVGAQRDGGWGAYAEPFLRLNREALNDLEVACEFRPDREGTQLRLKPGGSAGAIPLRSPLTGRVASGLVVRPRFGWSGVGRVLSEIGFHSEIKLLEGPLVPGSGREVPPWVLAGPVLARLARLLKALRRGFRLREDTLQRLRGRVLWGRYLQESIARGRYQDLPCRFPDLDTDRRLRSYIRWAAEKLHRDLVQVEAGDPVARLLLDLARKLLEELSDATPIRPLPRELDLPRATTLQAPELLQGLQALGWICDERGLGGGRQQDGLAWTIPLPELWERYVESVLRQRAFLDGATLSAGRLRETLVPLAWDHRAHGSLGHLVPDFVVRRRNAIEIVDAKYKSHFAELNARSWTRMTDDLRSAHRHDLHQVLAYASLYEADEVTATLAYPLRPETYTTLSDQGREVATATVRLHSRTLRLRLEGLPFGGVSGSRPRGQ